MDFFYNKREVVDPQNVAIDMEDDKTFWSHHGRTMDDRETETFGEDCARCNREKRVRSQIECRGDKCL